MTPQHVHMNVPSGSHTSEVPPILRPLLIKGELTTSSWRCSTNAVTVSHKSASSSRHSSAPVLEATTAQRPSCARNAQSSGALLAHETVNAETRLHVARTFSHLFLPCIMDVTEPRVLGGGCTCPFSDSPRLGAAIVIGRSTRVRRGKRATVDTSTTHRVRLGALIYSQLASTLRRGTTTPRFRASSRRARYPHIVRRPKNRGQATRPRHADPVGTRTSPSWHRCGRRR